MQKVTKKGFSDFEKAAMKERAQELLLDKKDGEGALLAKIAEMSGTDRTIAEKLHTLIQKNVPNLQSKTWYGMPAYANSIGKVVCFFQCAQKFKARYATLGFSDMAKLDKGGMWPTAYAITNWTKEIESQITQLLKDAVN